MIRQMQAEDRYEVADLICVSTNYWYQSHGRGPIFSNGPESTAVFFDVYRALDGEEHGIVCVDDDHGWIMGSCFIHPRPTHISLGILNVHPNWFGRGVARELMEYVIDFANRKGKPARLVSSALNLDSYSLYNKLGFTPRKLYQDMILGIPESGLAVSVNESRFVRDATLDDVNAITDLEIEMVGIRRDGDFRYFLENELGIWGGSVYINETGALDGFMFSVCHPGSNMIGPGLARTPEQAAALVLAEAKRYPGRSPVFLVPVECGELARTMYSWGARNCEMHVHQVLGEAEPIRGVFMPTFMPESA